MPLAAGLAQDSRHPFQLVSSTFESDTFLPISAIYNNTVNGRNVCSLDGSPGGESITGAVLDKA